MADDGQSSDGMDVASGTARRKFLPTKINRSWWIWVFGPWASIWYTAFVLVQIWPDWAPATVPAATSTYFGFVLVSLVYIVIQFLAMLRGTAGRNVTKEGAVLGDAAISLIFPLIGYGILGFYYARGEYRPTELDVQFFVIALIITILDVAGFTWIAYRANRRGDEIHPDNH